MEGDLPGILSTWLDMFTHMTNQAGRISNLLVMYRPRMQLEMPLAVLRAQLVMPPEVPRAQLVMPRVLERTSLETWRARARTLQDLWTRPPPTWVQTHSMMFLARSVDPFTAFDMICLSYHSRILDGLLWHLTPHRLIKYDTQLSIIHLTEKSKGMISSQMFLNTSLIKNNTHKWGISTEKLSLTLRIQVNSRISWLIIDSVVSWTPQVRLKELVLKKPIPVIQRRPLAAQNQIWTMNTTSSPFTAPLVTPSNSHVADVYWNR